MSQGPKRTRVLQLAGSVWPRREVDGYANLIAARLRKLAATESTGMLPISGRGDGAIFFRAGQVVYAESSRTSLRREVNLAALGSVPGGVSGPAAGGIAQGADPAAGVPAGAGPARDHGHPPAESAELVPVRSLRRLAGMLALTERTIDAVTELLSSESRYAKFRHSHAPALAQVHPIPVGALLREAERRRDVLRQLAAVLTPDTPVVRNMSSLAWPSLQVSPPQWALIVRAGDGMTPRGLAMELGRSVFATTIETYRLLALGLLAVPGQPPAAAGMPDPVMSFLRAIPDERQ